MSAQALRGQSRKRSILFFHRTLSHSSFLGSCATTRNVVSANYSKSSQSVSSFVFDGQRRPFLRSFSSPSDGTRHETDPRDPIPTEQLRENSPLAKLNQYYLQEHGIVSVASNFHASSLTVGGVIVWTAVFVCPVTKQLFLSGTLRNIKDKIEPVADSPEVYYKTKKLATHAAAARALDQFQYHSSRDRLLCEEDPGSNSMTQQDLAHKFSSLALEDFVIDKKNQAIESVDSELVGFEDDELLVGYDAIENALHVEEQSDEEKYIVTTLNPLKRQSPYKALLEALTTSPMPYQWDVDRSALHLPTGYNFVPYVRLNAARKAAYSWVEAMNEKSRTTHTNDNSPHVTMLPGDKEEGTERTLQTGKAILYQLAQAYQGVLFSRRKRGVQPTAEAVLNVLWRTRGLRPDADAYAYYLKCLEGNDVASVAKAAENIVLAMKNGTPDDQGRVLPKPNTLVINSLIQVWAQQGGKAGRYNRTFDGFEPDRESFLSLLSSSSYLKKDDLDLEFLRKCLSRMEVLEEEGSSEQSLVPGPSEYNAPLRWSGGPLTQVVRPYGRYVQFDRYDRLVPSFDDNQVIPVEQWVQEIESKGMATIETYEALIQAHIRTRSYAGFQKALEVADKLLKDPTKAGARLLTFHPIVAAWLHSGHDEASAVLSKLLHDLSEAGELHPDLMPDGRMIDALLATYVQKQSKILTGDRNEFRDPSVVENMRFAADTCFEKLEELCDRFEQSFVHGSDRKVFIETSTFVHCLQSWRNVIDIIDEEDTSELFSLCVERVWETYLKFEKVLQVTRNAGNDAHFLQLDYLISQGHHVNALVVDILHLLRKQRSEDSQAVNDEQIMFCVERIIRRSGELAELLRSRVSDEQSEDDEVNLFYGDHFFYWRKHPLASEMNEEMYIMKLLSLIRGCWVDGADRGPILRMTYLLKDQAIFQEVPTHDLQLINSLIADVFENRREHAFGDLYLKSGVKDSVKPKRTTKEGQRRDVKSKRQRFLRRRISKKMLST
ncbi:hypothetical protein FisN_3Lh261 [Fistulifera solaris]|uniref:Uncharacterized protein n=1 Tax=Fistulifera solaris TaxID=1519565 RepID=A0A1Z5JP53_FISSO|nr:hypothetical protein FisN_3Lh261 [Fistulifera solaris]|eukprot:GAX15815.1 hypothetical protein FisN_3Lh261 [Fistulifera solaris]